MGSLGSTWVDRGGEVNPQVRSEIAEFLIRSIWNCFLHLVAAFGAALK